MIAKLFQFRITDFEEVYTIIDDEKKRLHISSVHYQYNMTLDLTRDLSVQIHQLTQFGEVNFNKKVQQVAEKIIKELNLTKG